MFYPSCTVQRKDSLDDDKGEKVTDKGQKDHHEEDKDEQAVDRAAAMEDCSRLLREAEESVPLAETSREALAVLGSTLLVAGGPLSPQAAAAVSVGVASAVTEAEGLVDELLRVIQASEQAVLSQGNFPFITLHLARSL